MDIPNVTPYSGQKPIPGQDQPTFNQNMSDELDYLNTLPEELNPAIDAMNQTATDIDDAKTAAEAAADSAATSATASAASANYQGDFISGVTSATAGESYSFNDSTWLCLVNTTTDPVNGSANWRKVVSLDDVNEAEERLLGPGAKIYRGSNGQYVQDGDSGIPLDTTALSHLIDGSPEDVINWDGIQFTSITTVPSVMNAYGGYDFVTDNGTVEFVDLAEYRRRKTIIEAASVAYNLDVELGNIYKEGITPASALHWFVYGKKIVTGSADALPATPVMPHYFVRNNRKLLLDDYITTFGVETKDDIIDWQYAVDAAWANILAGFSGLIRMNGGRDYRAPATEIDLNLGVGFIGEKCNVYGGGIKSASVIYVAHIPSTYLFSWSSGNCFKNVGLFYSQQNWGDTIENAVDMGEFVRLSNAYGKGSYGTLENFSASGNSKILGSADGNDHAAEYTIVKEVAVSATPHGPIFDVPLSTDLYTYKTLHVNPNINSSYNRRYGEGIGKAATKYTTAAISKAHTDAIVFKLGRSDGGTFDDILVYGMPYGVVAGSKDLSDDTVTDAASATFINVTFDVCSRPVIANCPTGAFGLKFIGCGALASTAAGDTDQVIVTLGDSASEHYIPFENLKLQYGAGVTAKFAEANSVKATNSRIFVNNSQLSTCAIKDLALGTNKLFVGQNLRNLTEINVQEAKTNGTKTPSLLGGNNLLFTMEVNVPLLTGETYKTLANIDYPYTGLTAIPELHVTTVRAPGGNFPQDTVASGYTSAETITDFSLKAIASQAATSDGNITVRIMAFARDTEGVS